MRRALLVLLLGFAMSLAAADAPLAAALAAARKGDAGGYCDDESHDPVNAVCRAIAIVDADAALQSIAKELRVSPAVARVIALALLPTFEEPQRFDAQAKAALREAAARETDRKVLVIALAQVGMYREDHEDREAAWTAMLPLIGAAPDLAIAAADAVNMPEGKLIFLGDAYAHHAGDAELIDAIGEATYDSVLRAAFGPLRITRDGVALRDPVKPDTLAERAQVQLNGIAELALPELLLAAYDALPKNVRSRLASADEGLQWQLAAAAMLADKPALAAELAARIPPPQRDYDEHAAERAIVTSADKDPFEVVVQAHAARGVTGLLFAEYAERNGYASLAAESRRALRVWDDPTIPPALRDGAAAVRERVEAANAARNAPSQHVRPDAPSSLAAARIVPFTERRLDDDRAQALTSPVVIDCSDAQNAARTTHLPPFVTPIRMERSGSEIAAVVISAALDPTGEVGLGGYWILRSRDDGATWATFYTGLRENLPYVVPPASRLPLLHGDRLLLEVEVRELDLASITFPPVGLRTARTDRGLYLDIAWADLTRDSDGDGLTDLLEERLTTDPREIDTDGDGISDGDDNLPRVKRTSEPSVAADVLGAVLAGYGLGGGRLVVGLGGAEPTTAQACEIRTSYVVEPVLFLVGDPAAFGPLTLSRRTIVLTEDEAEEYSKKFGPTYGARILHFAIDPSGTRALIELNQSWAATTYVLRKGKDGWVSSVVSSWIS